MAAIGIEPDGQRGSERQTDSDTGHQIVECEPETDSEDKPERKPYGRKGICFRFFAHASTL
jgi:hypothetical protein